MNFTERKNYIIAGFVSLIIHFFLLTIDFTGIPVPKKPALETFPVSIIEISSGNKSRQLSVTLNLPGIGQPEQEKTEIKSAKKPDQPSKDTAMLPKKEEVTALKEPESQSASSGNAEIKSAKKPDQSSKDAATLPKKEEVTAKKPENQSAPGGNTGETIGSGNSNTSRPRSSEAMVQIVGPMPTYPHAALKEGKEGEVAVRILVNADGKVDLVIVTKSSGDIRLDYAATSSVERKWKFTSINEGYYIDLIFSFDIDIGASVKFLDSRTRSRS